MGEGPIVGELARCYSAAVNLPLLLFALVPLSSWAGGCFGWILLGGAGIVFVLVSGLFVLFVERSAGRSLKKHLYGHMDISDQSLPAANGVAADVGVKKGESDLIDTRREYTLVKSAH